jgi:HSP20 family protein
MSIVRWKPLQELLDIREDIDRLFERPVDRSSFRSFEERYSLPDTDESLPAFEMFEQEGNLIARLEFPGLEKGDIKVGISGDVLAIKSEVNRESELRGVDHYRYERGHGSFVKTIRLPVEIEKDRAYARYVRDTLEIIMPKASRTRGSTEPVRREHEKAELVRTKSGKISDEGETGKGELVKVDIGAGKPVEFDRGGKVVKAESREIIIQEES